MSKSVHYFRFYRLKKGVVTIPEWEWQQFGNWQCILLEFWFLRTLTWTNLLLEQSILTLILIKKIYSIWIEIKIFFRYFYTKCFPVTISYMYSTIHICMLTVLWANIQKQNKVNTGITYSSRNIYCNMLNVYSKHIINQYDLLITKMYNHYKNDKVILFLNI